MAECKATAKPIGGDDINKFVGALQAERRKLAKEEVAGYFLSLSGVYRNGSSAGTGLGFREGCPFWPESAPSGCPPKVGWPNLIRVDYHGFKEVPTGTCHSILKAAGLKS